MTWETLEATYERGRKALEGSPDYLAKQERLGLERMLIHKTMVLTGLRLGELASITVGQLHLDAPQPHAELLARDAKAGSAALIPLRHDLAEDLRHWLDEKLQALRGEAEEKGAPLPLMLPAHEPLFSIPRNLVKSFNLDLAGAMEALPELRVRVIIPSMGDHRRMSPDRELACSGTGRAQGGAGKVAPAPDGC